MSRLSTFYQSGRLAISFELFPPRTPKGEDSLYEHVEKLHTGDDSPHLVKEIKRHCDHGIGSLTELLVERGAVALVFVNLVLDKGVFTGYHQTDDALT